MITLALTLILSVPPAVPSLPGERCGETNPACGVWMPMKRFEKIEGCREETAALRAANGELLNAVKSSSVALSLARQRADIWEGLAKSEARDESFPWWVVGVGLAVAAIGFFALRSDGVTVIK